MKSNYLDKLEYEKIIKILSSYCITTLGKEAILKLEPSFGKSTVSHLLLETTEAVNIIVKKGNPPISNISDNSVNLKHLKSSKALTICSLLDMAKLLRISRQLKSFFVFDDELELNNFPILSDLFSCIYQNMSIENRIFDSIFDDNTLSDNASTKLSTIRKSIKKRELEIRDKLNNFIHSSSNSKYIMDNVVTIRNNRFVVPVKEEYKSMVKGFVHDVSSSGSSVFIEPLFVFDMNNELSNLRFEEQLEIQRILEDLSSLLYKLTYELELNISTIAKLDCLFAKAKYSFDINGIMPIINSNKYVNLINARHPLIQKNIVVPINISIGESYNCLVITGPNTGGKTVSLKTMGTILLMAYSGIYIPCDDNSEIFVFDNIYADIGDEQSLQESLSTFSSHMTNIVDILNNFTPNSLILLDELRFWNRPNRRCFTCNIYSYTFI